MTASPVIDHPAAPGAYRLLESAFDAYASEQSDRGRQLLEQALALEPVLKQGAAIVTPPRNYAAGLLPPYGWRGPRVLRCVMLGNLHNLAWLANRGVLSIEVQAVLVSRPAPQTVH